MTSKLNKALYTDITKLKLLDTDNAEPRFRLKDSPFTDNGDEEQLTAQKREEYVITGQIFPKSDIYRERSYLIELKLTKTFPMDPPEVRFLTPIYHINVAKDGVVCNELLKKTHKWTSNTSLIQVITAVVTHIDHPDIDSSRSFELGIEYVQNRDEFNRKALESVRKHGLPRE